MRRSVHATWGLAASPVTGHRPEVRSGERRSRSSAPSRPHRFPTRPLTNQRSLSVEEGGGIEPHATGTPTRFERGLEPFQVSFRKTPGRESNPHTPRTEGHRPSWAQRKFQFTHLEHCRFACGTDRIRTDNLLGASQALSAIELQPQYPVRESNPPLRLERSVASPEARTGQTTASTAYGCRTRLFGSRIQGPPGSRTRRDVN